MTQPLLLSIILEESATPVLKYAARRFVEQLSALSGVSLGHVWLLRPESKTAAPSVARAWNVFDSGRSGIPKSNEITAATRIASVEELPVTGKSDFIFVFSSRSDTLATCATRAKRGAFEFRHHGAPLAGVADLGWPEVLGGSPRLSFELCLLRANDERAISFGPWEARTHRASPAGTAKELIDGCSLFLGSALQAFLNDTRTPPLPGVPARGNAGRSVDNGRALALWNQFVLRKASGRFRHARVKNCQWGLGLISGAADPLELQRPPAGTRWLAPAAELFWADPFLVDEQQRTFVLFEELGFADWRGHLCAAELGASPFTVKKILEKPFHLSFPFCFRHGNELYLLPEQAQSGRVQAYRAKSFPDSWEDGPVLLPDFPGIDNVLLEHENLWWLFTTSARDGNHDNHLMLFYAKTPFGPFSPHPLNPVCMGLEGSRMAGAIMRPSGKLVRPGQNCSRSYGGSLLFFEIERLSMTEYRERRVHESFPDPESRFPDALHTWNTNGKYTAIDGLRDLPRFGRTSAQVEETTR